MALVLTMNKSDVVKLTCPDGSVILLRGNEVKGTSMRLDIQAAREVLIERVGKHPLGNSLGSFVEQ